MAELVASNPDLTTISIEEAIVDLGVNPEEAYERGKTDYNFFAGLCLPQVMLFALPDFYLVVWSILVTRKPEDLGKILRFALGLPRGHAKTTFIKVIICWLIVYDKFSFALMVCASEDLAEQLLADIDDMLGSANMEAVYGDWQSRKSTDTKQLKKALYHNRPVILAAKGAGSSVRGLNIKHTRPDLIFCDDMQTRENDESPVESARLLRWMVATLLKLLAPRGDRLIIYVGNMYSEECILKKLQNNPGWTSLVTGAILDTGQPLWPELHSLESLMESYFHDEELGLADIWFAEVMNDPKSEKKSLLHDVLPICPYDEHTVWDAVFITIDPAGFRKASDANEIIVHGVIDQKNVVIDRASSAIEPEMNDPEKLIIRALEMALAHGASLIGIEQTGYQVTLLFWVNKYILHAKIEGIVVVPLDSHGRSKEMRIRLDIKEMFAGNNYILPHVRPAYVYQATKYKIGQKENKDDLLDAVAYRNDVRNEYSEHLRNMKTISMLQHDAHVVANNTAF